MYVDLAQAVNNLEAIFGPAHKYTPNSTQVVLVR